MGLNNIEELLDLDYKDVEEDIKYKGKPNLTSSDSARMLFDLAGRNIISQEQLKSAQEELKIKEGTSPILHPNQYHHLLERLYDMKIVGESELNQLEETLPKVKYNPVRNIKETKRKDEEIAIGINEGILNKKGKPEQQIVDNDDEMEFQL